jgi:hypothetical protein
VTIAMDLDRSKALPWIERANPTHKSVIDSSHITGELFGFTNVPMAVWIDEELNLVRPAESAALTSSPSREIPANATAEDKRLLTEVNAIPDVSVGYKEAVLDWVEKGAGSQYSMSPDQVIGANTERTIEHSRAAAAFELGQFFFKQGNQDKARTYWRMAHEAQPENWTYKRQAWTIETTPEGEPSDLRQDQTNVYEGSWIEDVIASGGGANYQKPPNF